MPKNGFRSITISESIYNKFNRIYLGSKDELAIKGIRSLSGYISYMLESRMQEDEALARHVPMIKKIAVEEDRVVLLDNEKNRIAEVVARDGELYCQLCEVIGCMHAGFAYALPEVNAMLDAQGA